MTDVAIIGGGIVGLACARECARAGMRVTLLEYGRPGMQATNAAAGMLAPFAETAAPGPLLDLGLRALAAMPALVAALEEECAFDIELRLDGILRVAYTEAEMAALKAQAAMMTSSGHIAHTLDPAQCLALEPRLSPRIALGVLSTAEGSVSNQQLALALERSALGAGARIRQRAPVVGFRTKDARVTAVRTPDGDVPCDIAVIAAGARSGQVARRLPAPSPALPVFPVRGQMLALGGMSTPVRHVIWGPRGYLVPRANGLVFAGATVERVGFRRRTTQSGIRSVRAAANGLVPQLAAARHLFDWAGLRPGSPDGLPVMGPLPGWPNVVAATGHYRGGILLGPLTGAIVARALASGSWDGLQPFSPARFHLA